MLLCKMQKHAVRPNHIVNKIFHSITTSMGVDGEQGNKPIPVLDLIKYIACR